jgi:zinc ribbon protein
VTDQLCPDCGTPRPDFSRVCPACGAPPETENRTPGEGGEGVRAADLEPYVTLRYIARLFKVLAVLILLMLVGEVVTGLLIDGSAALLTLIGEATRLLVMAGLLWAGGDLTLLLIDAGHDLRVARILLGRINAQAHAGAGTNAAKPPAPASERRS